MNFLKLVKNTFGVSSIINNKMAQTDKVGYYAGSSITRSNPIQEISDLIHSDLEGESENLFPIKKKAKKKGNPNLRSMSNRTKSKIRRKIIALSMVSPKLSFLTLTFCNVVDDRTAYKIFRVFMDNAKKRIADLEYLWVIERQNENATFPGNPHFHVINNSYWNIDKWWPYWLEIQSKYGITPRDQNFKPSSAFDIRRIRANNLKGLGNYLTKYITKNKGEFDCQVWNCTKKISWLYTDFYSDGSFIEKLEKLENAGSIGGELKRVQLDWVQLLLVPLNKTTMRLYECLKEVNQKIWNNPKKSILYAIQPPKLNHT
jgi:hypothetical protein